MGSFSGGPIIRMVVLVVLLFQLRDKNPASETHSDTCFHKEVSEKRSLYPKPWSVLGSVPYERHQYLAPQEEACKLSKKDGQKKDCTGTT